MDDVGLWDLSTLTAGELSRAENSGYEQEFGIKSHLIHPDYPDNDHNFENDICLLFLDGNLEFNENVKNVSLIDVKTLQDETECVVSGWGTLRVSPAKVKYRRLSIIRLGLF